MLSWKWVDERLQESENYWISTTTETGKPHLVPIWGIWFENQFYFGSGRNSRKLANIARNPYCVIATDDSDQPVIVEGSCKKINDMELLEKVLKIYIKKFHLPFKPSRSGITDDQGNSAPIFIVKPKKVIVWKKFPSSATKWIFQDK